MNAGDGKRIFVTGARGFIGTSLLDAAIAEGYRVAALTRDAGALAGLRAQGADAIVGDLGDASGRWREAVSQADAVVHLAQPQTFGGRVTKSRARDYGRRRLAMDRALFEAIDPARTTRIIYVAGTSYYGDTGASLCAEDAVPHPSGWGPYLAPAIEAVPAYTARGLPIVAAFPGWVYGPGSWFAEYVLAPLHAGKPVYGLSGRKRFTSPIHVEDCARAILHLVRAGEAGQRYFLVDDLPVEGERLADLAAQALGVAGRARKLPFWLLKAFVGPVIAESLAYENRLSNNRLRSSGFLFKFATCEQGVPDVVARWLRENAPP